MPTSAFTSAGTTIRISAALPVTYDAAGFAALTYTLLSEVTDAGEYGRVYDIIKHNPLNTAETFKLKGSYDSGQMNMKLGRVPADAGQTLLIAALNSNNAYSFKVTLQNGTVQYFIGKVASYTTNVGTSGQVTGASALVEIDGAIVEV